MLEALTMYVSMVIYGLVCVLFGAATVCYILENDKEDLANRWFMNMAIGLNHGWMKIEDKFFMGNKEKEKA